MLKKLFAVAALAGVMSVSVYADQKPAEVIDVKVCPMAMKAVKGEGAGNETVGKYKVFFCCGGCKGNFAALSAEDKEKKVAAAVKAQEEAAKKAAEAPAA